jgi:plastocyanin
MRRTMLAGAVVAAALAMLGPARAALAGGGCHGGMTEADATGQDEATIRLVNACFDASVMRIDPGASVTFSHEDPGLTHNVGGTEWGFYGDMRNGDTFTATFDDPGVYPFACSYHPGMTGAIVVGDGYGAGTGWTVLSTEPSDPAAERPQGSPVAATEDGSPLALLGIGALGLALGAAAVVGIGRLRKPTAV